jgi:hypothetical protein
MSKADDILANALTALFSYYYPEDVRPLPLSPQKPKSEWTTENKYWFFWAVLTYGIIQHTEELQKFLKNDEFERQQVFSSEEFTFIDKLFNHYILPFHKSYNFYGSRPNTPKTGSRPSSASKEDNKSYSSNSSSSQFPTLISNRDKVCLFCWGNLQLDGAYIIAKKNTGVDIDEDALLIRTGMDNKYVVQNGLLLCKVCHGEFDLLKRYVDPICSACSSGHTSHSGQS